MFRKSFSSLTEAQQADVYLEIVNSAGRGNTAVAALAKTLGRVGKRLVFVSLAIAVYEISEAEDKPHEVARQGSLVAAGVAGRWAMGTSAVALGACAATAPVCVDVVALIGGLLFAFGTDLAFDSIYPQPALR